MMMGTPEGQELKQLKEEEKVKFVEDMTPEERARILKEKTGEVLPAGLENLGNTCYMNSTVQCLKRVNELKDALKSYPVQSLQSDPDTMMARACKKLFGDLDNMGEAFPPVEFVQTLRACFPQFDETDQQGRHKQQDADECYTNIL